MFVACDGGFDSGSDLIRPQTLEELVITTPAGDTFEFVRSFSSDAAEDNGDIERGSFIYTSGGTNVQLYPSLSGDNSDVQFPDSVNLATYEYLAVNDTSGVITLNGVGVNDLDQTGTFSASNGSFAFFFNSDSLFLPQNQVIVDVTFISDGSNITDITSTWAIANSGLPDIDTVVIDASLSSTVSTSIQNGHNPELDLERESRLVPDTFTGLVFVFTDDDGTEPEVRLQFQADPGNVTVLNVDETGQALLRVNNGVVIDGVDYMAERTEQTSDVELVLSGPGNPQEGTYTLEFESLDSGIVTQTSGSGALLTGRFEVFDSDVF